MIVSNATTGPASSRGMDVAIAALAVGAIAGITFAATGEIDGWRWFHWICKPLTTLLILWMVVRTNPAVSTRYRRWMAAGMVASLAGDVFLMLPQDAFVPGLVSFLLAHLCFIVALLTDSRFAERPWGMLACVAYGAFNLWALWPSLPAALHLPVMVYVLVLASMGGQAVVRVQRHAMDALTNSAQWSVAGALLFMLSDTLLAWNRFRFVIPLSGLWVLATYYAALWCLARSVRGSR
ncbi:lysoplasmalogenase [Dyella sp.]|uniref:lysoplasmalogenase n=1 Tax=Dyella sp. TaxID=1869338 RepID=UPI00284329FF|nr:lysoplasmalogenase [Dyella sp.]MDR3447454.1 lysoplasmalogenase [Dyella sp.]